MPYRRLPNTDLARLRSLQTALQRAEITGFNEQVLPYKLQSEIQQFLSQFENTVLQSKENYTTKVSANKQYRHKVQKARMYISHFIQVFNLAVIRGEIKKEQKKLYGLDPESHIVPDLSTEESLLEWGKKIIEGEQKRTAAGGFAIYLQPRDKQGQSALRHLLRTYAEPPVSCPDDQPRAGRPG